LKVVIENLDENQLRNRKDSLINPLHQHINMKIDHDDHHDIIKDQGSG